MATLSSLQDAIQDIGSRLRAENDSKIQSATQNNISEKNEFRSVRNTPTLDFTRNRSGSERIPKNCEYIFIS